jgi:hypothetical protein
MFNEYDMVTPRDKQFRESLGENLAGTIVMVYQTPNRAYEVEFCDKGGITIALKTMTDDELDLYIPPK